MGGGEAGPLSWALENGQLFLGILSPALAVLLCPSVPSERPWGLEECVCALGMGGGCHRPAGAGSERLLPERSTVPFVRREPSQPAYMARPGTSHHVPFGSSSAFTVPYFSYLHVCGGREGVGNNTITGFERIK